MTARSRRLLILLAAVALIALPAAAHAATVTIQTDPSGRVTSQPAGIDCPGTCTATFAQGATLTAQPAQGYAFGDPGDHGAPGNKDGWITSPEDTCAIAPGQPQVCTLAGNADSEITAHFRPAAQLDVVPSGRGSVTATIPAAGAGEQASQTCDGDPRGGVSCEYTYLPGRDVTLVASPDTNEGPSSFVRWSDERCPAGPVCTLTMDAARQSIVALFTPQRVSVRVRGTGRVTSTPAGLDCQGDPDADTECSADFPIGTDVSLAAADTSPLPPQLPPAWYLPCDFGGGSACGITADRARWAAIGFDGQQPDIAQVPPTITVRFHILKAGSGSGRVQGDSIDCGGSCSVLRDFGARQTLTAMPDAGSHFAGWRSACSSAATCTLAVGPVTAVTAAFDATGSSPPSGSSSSSAGQGTSTVFRASLGRPVVKGHGGKRVVVFRVRVSTPATVRARLTRKQRTVASRSWRVGAGLQQLRLRLPRKAKAGAYRLRLTVRDASGHAKSFAPSLLIPR
jgi:hypothetical protein